MKLKKLEQAKVKEKKVFLRVDSNLPISARGGSASGRKNGKILDDTRIREVLPTIEYLINKKAKIILASHLGRPLEKLITYNSQLTTQRLEEYSLKPVADYLKKFKIQNPKLKRVFKNLKFIPDLKKAEATINKMKPGEIVMLENLRFYPEEEKNDLKFAKKLADLADVYINDAFAVSHRPNASVSAITKFLPSHAGFLLEKEIKNLTEVLANPKHPFVVLLGGAKISTKIGLIKNLEKIADKILIGGALANNFLASQGYKIGKSLYEKEMIELTNKLLYPNPYTLNPKIVLPIDVRIKLKIQNPKFKINPKSKIQNLKLDQLDRFKNFEILDIGDETIKLFAKFLKSAKMIVWNGPMGLFEEKPFDRGTNKIAKVILANRKAKMVIGGGETIASLKIKNLRPRRIRLGRKKSKIKNNVFISTGGGAMLEFLEGKILPGISPLLGK